MNTDEIKIRYIYDNDGYVYDTQKSALPMSREHNAEEARLMAEYWNWFEYYDWMRANYSIEEQIGYLETFQCYANHHIKSAANRYIDMLMRELYRAIK